MKTKAQGAMEYLMSYGWAILVVLVVGAAMWQLGIINISPSTTTSRGFNTLKPVLASCEMSQKTLGYNFWGLGCEFINAAGGPIRLWNISTTVNGKTCYGSWVYNRKQMDLIVRWCNNENGVCPALSCQEYLPASIRDCSYQTGTKPYGIRIEKGNIFLLFIAHTISQSSKFGPCYDFKPGQPYDFTITYTYDEEVAGQTITKTDTGIIRIVPTTRGEKQ